MPPSRYAILLDGGFVTKKLKDRLGHPATAQEIKVECDRIKAHAALSGMALMRIYFYDAPPAEGRVHNPLDGTRVDLASSALVRANKSRLDQLELMPDFALRLGEAVAQGWKIGSAAMRSLRGNPRALVPGDLIPDINQKGVDLRIGLDMARLALRGLVSVVVVVTGDSDLVPAFKFVRREGLRIYLDHLGHGVRRDLKAHADLIL